MTADIWSDKTIREVLKERPAHDIQTLPCPRCGVRGFYNEGSYFTCGDCDESFEVVGDDEDPPEGQWVSADEMASLSDLSDAEGRTGP